ncbi:hypothetical protein Vretimale_13470, partial [Volvox reticuliferus]
GRSSRRAGSYTALPPHPARLPSAPAAKQVAAAATVGPAALTHSPSSAVPVLTPMMQAQSEALRPVLPTVTSMTQPNPTPSPLPMLPPAVARPSLRHAAAPPDPHIGLPALHIGPPSPLLRVSQKRRCVLRHPR